MNASEEHRSSSNSPGVADDWENEDGDKVMEKQLQERFKQIRILQREKADKDARMEKARAEEEAKAVSCASDVTPVAPQQNVVPVKMQILRRPKSGDQLNDEERAKKEQEERERNKKPTLEERQAAYDLARSRIMGSDYKPEQAPVAQSPPTTVPSRNKSPEQIRFRKQSPDPAMYMPVMQPMQPPMMPYMVHPPPGMPTPQGMQQMGYNVPITTNQGFVAYFDASRPPPMMNSVAGPSGAYPNPQQQIQTFATGQYFGAHMPNMMNMRIPPPNQAQTHQQQQPQVPYGRPPMALYPAGTLGAAMQVNTDSGQSQSQRKNRHNKKKQRPSDPVQ